MSGWNMAALIIEVVSFIGTVILVRLNRNERRHRIRDLTRTDPSSNNQPS